jgi:serine kinase of HPr protein (carbohydrate metabolism regulator)
MSASTVHASAVLVGAKAVLIQGPSGSGKSSLVASILRAAETGAIPFARLIADDRTLLEVHGNTLLARPAPALAGLLEVRGVGIQTLPYEPVGAVGLVVSLNDAGAERLPVKTQISIEGIEIPYISAAKGVDPLPLVLAALYGQAAGYSQVTGN